MKPFFLKKPDWIKIKVSEKNIHEVKKIKSIIKKNKLYSVCEEASCPNIIECFSKKQVTFMILGNICTRNCLYCNVINGRPLKIDNNEALNLANTIYKMKLKYVVITSVNRDDLYDGGAKQFSTCIKLIRKKNPNTKIEILVPDFKNCINEALKIMENTLPDVFNHNIETVERLFKTIRPSGNYKKSLMLLNQFKKKFPKITTKSGLMLGFGETNEELYNTLYDLKWNGVDIITIGQYLQPTKKHITVKKYVNILEFNQIRKKAINIGFKKVVCGPFIRSSYNAQKYYIK
ncbi:lipoyl synthase [Enterobacteriaceae endosymbiont of Plateumaris consimilis]|uniref:lipoyl synthase n=1 Tax=Enterobacteriaceae endosymbiont of Plateumaris consimilis TaxID=2675794 RepID=UPI0014498D25|nr:lipoyl synthase [Enterobacteriaceae endosymbiont of Plateumaris consimilis]QJC28491.1 lipoyl synthase [Enterobacteriaceae endosymbiont of Plateumaris consimilis]